MGARLKPKLRLVTHRTIAKQIDVDTETLRDWVAKGEFPEPHSIFQLTWLYDAAMIEEWLDTGKWPARAKFKARRSQSVP